MSWLARRVCSSSRQEEGGDHAHAQSVHAAGGEADDAHQHRLHHHLQHSVWGNFPAEAPFQGFHF